MIIKALTATAMIAGASSGQALAVHAEPGRVIVGRPIAAAALSATLPAPIPADVPAAGVPTSVAPVLEPGAWMLAIAGFGVVGIVRRARVRTLAA